MPGTVEPEDSELNDPVDARGSWTNVAKGCGPSKVFDVADIPPHGIGRKRGGFEDSESWLVRPSDSNFTSWCWSSTIERATQALCGEARMRGREHGRAENIKIVISRTSACRYK